MKPIFSLSLMTVLLATANAYALTNGTFVGKAEGLYGPIEVETVTKNGKIDQIRVLKSGETKVILDAAINDLIPRILENQSTGVDATAGATFASFGIKAAVADSLKKASAGPEFGKKIQKDNKKILPNEEADIIVVGGGSAGLAAASEAAKQKNLKVVLLEKSAWTGGSAALSGGSLAVGGTELNKKGLPSDVGPDGKIPPEYIPKDFNTDEWVAYFKKRANDATQRPKDQWVNEVLLRKVGEVSPEVINEYVQNGITFTTHYPTADFGPGHHNLPGADNSRGIEAFKNGKRNGNSANFSVWMTDFAKKRGVQVRTNSKVTDLITNPDGTIGGVKVQGPKGIYELHGKKVILATGGIAQNRELFLEKNKHVKNIEKAWAYTNGGATGDALKFTERFSPDTTGYGFIAMAGIKNPYGFENELAWLPEEFVFLWVDPDGNRFTDELKNYYYHRDLDLLNKAGGLAWAITSPLNWGRYGEGYTFDDWLALADKVPGSYVKADTLEELAKKLGMNVENLKKSAHSYNEQTKDGKATNVWGTTAQPLKDKGPYYAIPMTTSVIATMHGFKLDDDFHVVNKKGEAIPNLFAVGETAYGNFFFEEYGATGTAIAIGINGGVLAARQAAKEIEQAK